MHESLHHANNHATGGEGQEHDNQPFPPARMLLKCSGKILGQYFNTGSLAALGFPTGVGSGVWKGNWRNVDLGECFCDCASSSIPITKLKP